MTAAVVNRPENPMSPSLSLAVIELVGGEALERSAAMLQEFAAHYFLAASIICRSGGCMGLDPASYPNVMIVEDGGDTIPKRRLCALEKSKADIICIIEDTMTISHGWVEGVKAAYAHDQVGAAWGSIQISASLGPRYWALAVLEYGRFLCPKDKKDFGDIIPGCCMTFRRQALEASLDSTTKGIFEQTVAEKLVQDGVLISHRADMCSIYSIEDEYSAKLSTRMSHGRLYAGEIAKGQSAILRLYGAMRSTLVPGVLILRGIRNSRSMGNDGLSFMKFFWLVMLSFSWGIGEVRGYLSGAGDSVRSWR